MPCGPPLARVDVERPRERGTEARQVRAALVCVDVVGEGEERLLVRGVPLHRHLDLADLARLLEVDHSLLQRIARALRVQVGDEVTDAALVPEALLERLPALVLEVDAQALGEERHLAEALLQNRAVVVDGLEDLEIRVEGDAGAAAVGDKLIEANGRIDEPATG